ncbi:MucBP domain-containing protein, partial [Listeria monocytogenes]|uniref:MucBP domain-containing protein n=1 Tax=Listeria monocytogenes TaxID=1639 RepID=UPI003F57110F
KWKLSRSIYKLIQKENKKDYSLVKKYQTNASGKISRQKQQTVDLSHIKKNSIQTSSYITVKYVDETGKELAISEVLNG